MTMKRVLPGRYGEGGFNSVPHRRRRPLPGLLAATIGRPDDASRHFEEALATNERIGVRPWLACTQCDYARALLDHDASGNTDKARLLLSDALTTYRELGMHTRAATASALTTSATD